jgi:hypothetical protein
MERVARFSAIVLGTVRLACLTEGDRVDMRFSKMQGYGHLIPVQVQLLSHAITPVMMP